MSKSSDLLKKRLAAALEPYGAIADFLRKTKFARATVENWRDGLTSPKTEDLDAIAAALDTTPWELIRPDGAEPAKPKEQEALRALLGVLASVDDPQILGEFLERSLGYARGMGLAPPKLKQEKAHSSK